MKKLLVLLFLVSLSALAQAQQVPDSLLDNAKVRVHMESGSVKTGYLIYSNDTEIKIWSQDVGFLKLDKVMINRIEYIPEEKTFPIAGEQKDFSHFYAVSNSAISPGKNNLYVRLPYSLSGVLDYGLSNNFTIGLNAYYFLAISANLRYKIDFSKTSRLGLSVGSYYAYFTGLFSDNALFSGRAVYTIGDAENNFSGGVNYLTNFNRLEVAIVSISGIKKLSERTSFLVDIFVAPDLRSLNLDVNYVGAGFLGLRIISRKNRCWDLGIFNILTETHYYNPNGIYSLDRFYIPVPYFQYAYKL